MKWQHYIELIIRHADSKIVSLCWVRQTTCHKLSYIFICLQFDHPLNMAAKTAMYLDIQEGVEFLYKSPKYTIRFDSGKFILYRKIKSRWFWQLI